MTFLADENFPITSFRILQAFGYDIKHVAFDMPSVADTDVTTFAIEEGRIILTFDGDYGTLIFKFGIAHLVLFTFDCLTLHRMNQLTS